MTAAKTCDSCLGTVKDVQNVSVGGQVRWSWGGVSSFLGAVAVASMLSSHLGMMTVIWEYISPPFLLECFYQIIYKNINILRKSKAFVNTFLRIS